MQYSTNYNLNKPQPADQFNIEHWNENTDSLDSLLKTLEVRLADQINNFLSHQQNTSNPHSVTKAQVGLGNCNNTADANKAVASAAKLTTARKVYVKLGTASTTETKDFSGDTAIPVSGTLPVANGGTGQTSLANVSVGSATNATSAGKLTTARKVYVKLGTASTTETKDFSGDTAIPVSGTLPVANGGTGQTSLVDSANALINSLSTGDSDPQDNDYYIAQYANGGTTITTFYRRPVSKLFNYIKNKLGSAAVKAAGSAAGNVPLVGTALGTTNNNILSTDSSGKLKPFGKTPDQIAYWGNGGGVCATAAATGAKTVSISGFALYTGVTVKVMFTNGNSNNAPTLNVNSTGAKNIKVVKAGTKITPPVHTGKWRGASSATSEAWQPLTTLELMYDGTDWVIIGNPVVEDYYSESQGYTVYANGLIRQWGLSSAPSSEQKTNVTFYISYSNIPSISVNTRGKSDSDYGKSQLGQVIGTVSGFSCDSNHGISNKARLYWMAIGY